MYFKLERIKLLITYSKLVILTEPSPKKELYLLTEIC